MILTKQHTWSYKIKRIFKYMVIWFVAMIVCSFVDATINHFTDSPWFDVKHDWKILYGAMIYRLVTTWNYDNS